MFSTKVLLIFVGCFLAFLAFIALMAFVARVPVRYNLRNIVVRWPINLLVAIAFTIVVGLLVVMLAFVNGMYRLTSGSAHAGNVIVLADGATDELFSSLGYRDVSKIELLPQVLTDEKGRRQASWELYMVVTQPRPGTDQARFLQLRGLDDPVVSAQVHQMELHEPGKWFSEAGVESVADGGATLGQAVLGEGIARELGKDQQKETFKVGDTFDMGPKRWVVVGVMKSAGSTFDSEIWVKRDFAGPLFGKTGHTTCVLRAADPDSAAKLAEDLTTNYKDSKVQGIVETVYYDKLNATNQQFLWAIGFVMFFMSIGGVVGVMIVMFAAISQRSKDIGVLRIVGFRSWQVLLSFFLESLLLAVIGGLIGCTVGLLANGWSATSMVSGGAGGGKSIVLTMSVSPGILMMGMLFALFMGCVGGLLPALFAMRVKPLESLR
jgi:ABC-type antimicrobial peptide transport system permease subunit